MNAAGEGITQHYSNAPYAAIKARVLRDVSDVIVDLTERWLCVEAEVARAEQWSGILYHCGLCIC